MIVPAKDGTVMVLRKEGFMEKIREWWQDFAPRHKLIAQFIKFYAFSMLVTLFQYL